MMMYGVYSEGGSDPRLRSRHALLQQDPKNEDSYIAQFDATHLPEAFGWWSFLKSDFVNVNNADECQCKDDEGNPLNQRDECPR